MKLDKIISREIIFSAKEVAEKAGVRGKFRKAVLDGGPKLVVRSGSVVKLPVPRPDLSKYNTLAVNIKPLSRFKCALITTLRHKSRSPGMTENDGNVSVDHFHQPAPWKGWTKVLLPAENLVAIGMPDGWKNIEELEMNFANRYGGGEIAIGDIELLAVVKPGGSRMTDEELFYEALDLGRPDMRPVARQVRAGKLDKAVKALAAVVRKRKLPDMGPKTWNTHFGIDTAEQICRGEIMGQALGQGDFNWRINPIGYLEWSHAFNRHTWMSKLSDEVAFAGKKDRVRYAQKLDRLIGSWIAQSPEPVGHSGGLDPAWETLSTSCRINWGWPRILAAAAKTRDFSDRTLVEFFKSIWGHSEHLLKYHGDCNWFVSESTAIMTAASIAPFFRRSNLWAKEAKRRLEEEICKQVFPDGVQFELAPGYHLMCADLFLRAWINGTFYGIKFSDTFVKRLTGMFNYRLLLSRPNGTIPLPNDSGCNVSEGPKEPDAKLGWAAQHIKRPEWMWAPGSSITPKALSAHFADAGYGVMRSGWDKRSLWAFMDAANFGAAHQHEDKLQIELYAYGTVFLIDPGIQSYQHDPLVNHCRRADGHNTILVDGCGQNRRSSGDFNKYEASSRGENFWASGKGLDVFTGKYDEAFTPVYGNAGKNKLSGLIHTRTLVFIKNNYWLILDSMTGTGRRNLEALWHFAPMHLKCDRKKGSFCTNRVGLANMELICRGGWSGAKLKVITGQDDPPQGFVAIDGEMKPAPCAVASVKTTLPFHGVTLAAPYESGTSSGLKVTCRDIGKNGMQIEIAGKDYSDLIFWRHTGKGNLVLDAYSTDAKIAVLRPGKDSKMSYAAVVDGSYLKSGSLPVIKGKACVIREI